MYVDATSWLAPSPSPAPAPKEVTVPGLCDEPLPVLPEEPEDPELPEPPEDPDFVPSPPPPPPLLLPPPLLPPPPRPPPPRRGTSWERFCELVGRNTICRLGLTERWDPDQRRGSLLSVSGRDDNARLRRGGAQCTQNFVRYCRQTLFMLLSQALLALGGGQALTAIRDGVKILGDLVLLSSTGPPTPRSAIESGLSHCLAPESAFCL